MAFIMPLLFISCSSDDEELQDNNVYYVKYELSMPSLHLGMQKSISVSTESGDKTFTTTSTTWENTYGSVSKNFTARLNCRFLDSHEYGYTKTHIRARILVSKNNEPFTVKADTTLKKDVSIKYTH